MDKRLCVVWSDHEPGELRAGPDASLPGTLVMIPSEPAVGECAMGGAEARMDDMVAYRRMPGIRHETANRSVVGRGVAWGTTGVRPSAMPSRSHA